jgi:hypothetical protein
VVEAQAIEGLWEIDISFRHWQHAPAIRRMLPALSRIRAEVAGEFTLAIREVYFMDHTKSVLANDIASKHASAAKIKSSELASQTKVKASGDIALGEAEHRHAMIAEAAYLTAEQRHFEAGHDVEDWLAAESALNLS